jgi:hypothetical protein
MKAAVSSVKLLPIPDRLGDALPGSLRSGRRPAIASPSPTTRESSLVTASISSSARWARSTFPNSFCVLQFFVQIGQPASISDLGPLIEHLVGVTQSRDMDSRPFEILIQSRQAVRRMTGIVLLALARNSSLQVEHVEFSAGMTRQIKSQITESLRVL